MLTATPTQPVIGYKQTNPSFSLSSADLIWFNNNIPDKCMQTATTRVEPYLRSPLFFVFICACVSKMCALLYQFQLILIKVYDERKCCTLKLKLILNVPVNHYWVVFNIEFKFIFFLFYHQALCVWQYHTDVDGVENYSPIHPHRTLALPSQQSRCSSSTNNFNNWIIFMISGAHTQKIDFNWLNIGDCLLFVLN